MRTPNAVNSDAIECECSTLSMRRVWSPAKRYFTSAPTARPAARKDSTPAPRPPPRPPRGPAGRELLDAGAERPPRHRAVGVHAMPEGALLAIVELAHREARPRHRVRRELAIEQRIAHADLGHDRGDRVLAHGPEALDLEPALEQITGQLAPEIAAHV